VVMAAEGSEPVVGDDLVHWINGTQINKDNSTRQRD